MRSQVSTPTIIGTPTNSPQAPVRTRRRAQSVAVQGNSIPQEHRRVSLFEANVSWIHTAEVDESSCAPEEHTTVLLVPFHWNQLLLEFPFLWILRLSNSMNFHFSLNFNREPLSMPLFPVIRLSIGCLQISYNYKYPTITLSHCTLDFIIGLLMTSE